jgi:hypothetical protein
MSGGALRSPSSFRTDLPGVFAVGEVRSGSVKRVASAVGEGSVVIHAMHQYLACANSMTNCSKFSTHHHPYRYGRQTWRHARRDR